MRLLFALLILSIFLVTNATAGNLEKLKHRLPSEQVTSTAALSGEEAIETAAQQLPSDEESSNLEELLAEICELAPNIDSLEVSLDPLTLEKSDDVIENKRNKISAERSLLARQRLAKAIALYQGGEYSLAEKKFTQIYRDFPHRLKAVYFIILCREKQQNQESAMLVASELSDLLTCRAAAKSLGEDIESQLDQIAADTEETTLSSAKQKELKEKLTKLFSKLKKINPKLATLPKSIKKNIKKGNNAQQLKEKKRWLRVEDMRKNMKKANKQLAAEKPEPAYQTYTNLHDKYPNSLRILYGMAQSKLKAGSIVEAKMIATKLLKKMRLREGTQEEREELNAALEIEEDDNSSNRGTSFVIASFNIFHGTDKIWEERLARSVNVIKKNKIDIVGLQEVRENQMKRLMKPDMMGTTHQIYPKKFKGKKGGFVSANSIIWNKERFKLIESKEIPFKYFDNNTHKLPQLKLEDRGTGQQFYVLNTHDPAFPENAKLRYLNAIYYADYLDKLAEKGLPIFFTGDFNSGYKLRQLPRGNITYGNQRKNLTYCILTRSGKFWDSYDASKNRTGEGPSSDNENSVDHIFVSRSVKVVKYHKAADGKKKNGSDVHDTIIAHVVVK